MKQAKTILLVGLVLTAAVWFFTGWEDHRQRRAIIEQRFSDVSDLTMGFLQLYETNAPMEIADLIVALETNGIKLHNPLAIDSSKPCYGIAFGDAGNDSGVVIEETTNANDDQAVVRGYADGHVSMERR